MFSYRRDPPRADLAPEIPGMQVAPNMGVYGGLNCSFPNGWIASVSGDPDSSQRLVSVSHNGAVRRIPNIIAIRDNRPNDDKHYLGMDELRELLTTLRNS